MPLSSNGLCDAEMTMPGVEAHLARQVGDAGVGTTPALRDVAPADRRRGRARARSSRPTRACRGRREAQRPVAGPHRTDERRAEARHRRVIERIVARSPADAVSAEQCGWDIVVGLPGTRRTGVLTDRSP